MSRIRMGTRFFGLVVLVFFLVSCASPAHRVLTANNTFYYYQDAYNDQKCTTIYNETCATKKDALDNLDLKIIRATAAVARKGDFPLQLKDVKEAEKALKGVFKK